MKKKKLVALLAFLSWIGVILSFMILTSNIDLEFFFGLTFLGILLLIEMIDTSFVKSRYVFYLRYIVVVYWIIFGIFFTQKISKVIFP